MEEGGKIESRPPRHDRQPPAVEDLAAEGARFAGKGPCVEGLSGVEAVEKMVRDAVDEAVRRARGLRRPGVEAAVNRARIRGDDLRGNFPRQGDRQIGLAACGRPRDDEDESGVRGYARGQ